ncbi:hypothetical protein D1953_14470 [Peribacillus asahii]|uniref:LXG domain-containing protein n=1 Tax=Peribacillus asahii TaxID=228899 RepID=A0A398B5F2_9BACI|nr:LXG domain-containing protein [Peribacillus asahii]RID84048.1 hypothetical protein D1953_14470 [Peribacillus asahii]
MKVLDVESLVSGMEATVKGIDDQQENITQLSKDVNDVISLGEAFSGKGAEAIKSFYQDCHVPFLLYYSEFLKKYRRVLKEADEAYSTVEPNKKGFVRESFLDGELKQGLRKVKNITIDLVDEVNTLTARVDDIVNLPQLRDDNVIIGVEDSQKKIEKTIENLNTFDEEQTKALKEVEEELKLLIAYVKELESKFKSGKISIDSFNSKQLEKMDSYRDMKKEMEKVDWNALSTPFGEHVVWDATAPFASKGATFGTVSEIQAFAETAYKVKKHGVGIEKYDSGFKVINGKHLDMSGKDYKNSYIDSQVKLGNGHKLKIAEHVRPSAAVKSTFMSKSGIIGIVLSTGENVVNNVQVNASAEKIVGDAVVDAGIGAATLAGGAVVVSAVVAGGVPLLGAAVIGFGFSIASTYVLDGIKIGKDEKNVSDSLKDGVQKGIKTVAGWLK